MSASPDDVNRARLAVEKVINAFAKNEMTTDSARAAIQSAMGTAGMAYDANTIAHALNDLGAHRKTKLDVLSAIGFTL